MVADLWMRSVAEGTNTIIPLSIGSILVGEKMSLEETASNICIRGSPAPSLTLYFSWRRSLGEHPILPVGVPMFSGLQRISFAARQKYTYYIYQDVRPQSSGCSSSALRDDHPWVSLSYYAFDAGHFSQQIIYCCCIVENVNQSFYLDFCPNVIWTDL